MPCLSGTSRIARLAVVLGTAAGLLAAVACSPSPETRTDAAEESPQTRTVKHMLGTAEVPADPKRVIVADADMLATAMSLGVPVVGAAKPEFAGNLPPFIDAEKLAKLPDIGWNGPKVEEVAKLRPDLIIGSGGQLEETYQQLRQIAPTVVLDHDGGSDWKQASREVATVFGKADVLNDRISAYEKRVQQFRTETGPRMRGVEISLVNVRDLNDIRAYTPVWCAGQIMREAGLTQPKGHQKPDEGAYFVRLSAENLPRIDADVLFYFVGSTGTNPGDAKAQADKLRASPLWSTLPVVKRKQVHQVDPRWWFECGTVQAANLVMDDLEKTLGKPA